MRARPPEFAPRAESSVVDTEVTGAAVERRWWGRQCEGRPAAGYFTRGERGGQQPQLSTMPSDYRRKEPLPGDGCNGEDGHGGRRTAEDGLCVLNVGGKCVFVLIIV